MNKNPIKQFLINPLMIPINIFNINEKSTPYLNNLIDFLYELFQSIFPYEKHELEITSILLSNGIDDETFQYIYLNDSIKESIKLIHRLKKDLINFYTDYASSIEYGDDSYIIYSTNYKSFNNFKIDRESVKVEFSKLYDFDDAYLSSISDNFCDFIEVVLDSISIDENLEINKGYDNMKKIDESIQTYLENELRDNVNDFDKSFGVKLKKPKKTIEDKKKFQIELNEYIDYLFNVIGEINDIKPKKIKKKYVRGEFTKYIIKNSKLWSDDYLNDTMAFRCRFVTHYFSILIKNIDKILDNIYIISTNKKNIFSEYSYKLEYLENLKYITNKFICQYIKTGHSSNFMEFVKLQTLSKHESENSKYNKISDQSFLLIKNLKSIIIKDHMVLFDTILKLSYMVATINDKKSLKNKFMINPNYKFSNDTETKKYIEKLGKEISKNKYGLSPLFKSYIKSRGIIWSKWENPSKNLKIGIMAIELYALCIDDKNAYSKICSIILN